MVTRLAEDPITRSADDGSTLAVRDLCFRYRSGDTDLFDGLTHSFTPGQVTAVTGPSGRGKSTLLYVLGLMLRPSSGTVLVADTAVSGLSDRQRSRIRAEQIGFVFQDSELDPTRPIVASVVEPALYAGRTAAQALPHARALLEQFGLAERAAHRPGQISGGQAQRVAVCRAMINTPSVLLADEPTGNLDPDNSTLVLDALHQAAQHGTVVVVATHDPVVVDAADAVLRL